MGSTWLDTKQGKKFLPPQSSRKTADVPPHLLVLHPEAGSQNIIALAAIRSLGLTSYQPPKTMTAAALEGDPTEDTLKT